MLTSDQQHFLQRATSKALATCGVCGVNVVPVSVIDVRNESTVVLYDFFMEKTMKNIEQNNHVALCAWSGLVGMQVKATVTYDAASAAYQDAVAVMREKFPTRTLNGVLTLSVVGVYDVGVEHK